MVPEAVLKNELGPLVRELGKIVVEYGAKTEAVSREQAQRMDLITAAVAKIVETTSKSVQIMEKSVESSAAVQRSTDHLIQHVQQQNADMQKLIVKLVTEIRPAPRPAVFESFAPAAGAPGGSNGGSDQTAAKADPNTLLEDVVAATIAAEAAKPAQTVPANGSGVNVDINFNDSDASSGEADAKRWWQRR
jgi:hypothetical protein